MTESLDHVRRATVVVKAASICSVTQNAVGKGALKKLLISSN